MPPKTFGLDVNCMNMRSQMAKSNDTVLRELPLASLVSAVDPSSLLHGDQWQVLNTWDIN